MQNEILHKYIREFRKLRIDRAHGNAPHQPVLLLAVIELIEQGHITENRVLPSPELVDTFVKYWTKVTDRKPNLVLPFFHLAKRKPPFWFHHANPGYEAALNDVNQIRGFTRLRKFVSYASFDMELFDLLIQKENREVLRHTIIDEYLADFKLEILSLIREEEAISEYGKNLLQYVENEFSLVFDDPTETEDRIRKPAFRREIMRIYDYTCVFCKLQVLTLDGESITEAAHIIPHSTSKNDDVRNGLSLCKLHHWAFDKYLISIDESYKVIVTELMSEKGPKDWKLSTLKGKRILLPEREDLYPSQEALAWHRKTMSDQ